MISVRYGAAADQRSNRIPNSAAVASKSARRVSTSITSATSKSTRMKNRPCSASPNCWLSRMLPPCRMRNDVTACTMPGRSSHAMVRTKSPTGSLGTGAPKVMARFSWVRGGGGGSVAELGPTADDVLLELLAHRVVDRRRLVLLELLLV